MNESIAFKLLLLLYIQGGRKVCMGISTGDDQILTLHFRPPSITVMNKAIIIRSILR